MLEQFSNLIIHFIEQAGYWGVFLLNTSEAALIPIPSEVFIPFSGFLVSKGTFMFIPVVLVATLGETVGSIIAYTIGRVLEETIIVNVLKKYGKFVLVTEHDYQLARSWFGKYGDKIVFLGRLVPGVRTFISLPAGILEMKPLKFVFYSFFGSLVWITVLTSIGYYLGDNWKSLEVYFRQFEIAIFILLVLMVLYYVNHKLRIIKF